MRVSPHSLVCCDCFGCGFGRSTSSATELWLGLCCVVVGWIARGTRTPRAIARTSSVTTRSGATLISGSGISKFTPRLRRLCCPEHGAHVEGVPFARDGARFTRKGHRYLTLVGDHARGCVVWALRARTKPPTTSSSPNSTRHPRPRTRARQAAVVAAARAGDHSPVRPLPDRAGRRRNPRRVDAPTGTEIDPRISRAPPG